jgi:formylglycine-generating enzyme required for sulfatase activity
MDAPMGTYIAFATAPGRTAADGNGTNGLYTQKILTHIRTPGLSLEGLFKRVRTDVVSGSGGQQVPWDSSSLMGDFFFMPSAMGAPNPATPATGTAHEPLAHPKIQQGIIETSTNAQGRPEMTINLGNGKQIILVRIPAGSFMMGSNLEHSSSKPIHKVTISRDFWIGKYPVTQDQWESVMCSNPSDFKGSNLPVEQVNWDDCQMFISELNTRGLGTFRLPTEAEWEYACRAGSTGHYYANPDDIAWYRKNNGGTPHPVGQKQSNSWGLCDMSGSVRQWCQDWAKFYPSGPETDPKGPSTGSWRVNRGGTWDDIYVCPSDERNYLPPSHRANYMGLRLVRNEP